MIDPLLAVIDRLSHRKFNHLFFVLLSQEYLSQNLSEFKTYLLWLIEMWQVACYLFLNPQHWEIS